MDEQQALTDHLTELRQRLIHAIYGIIIGFGICFVKSDVLFDIIRRPIAPFLQGNGLIFTAPMDKFLAHLKVSLLAGVIVSCPWWLYQIWKFVAPGLYSHERKYSVAFIFFGTLLFSAGVSFVYFIVYPMAFDFLMNYGGGTDTAMISISEYLSFFSTTTVVFGLAFELPLIMSVLGLVGIVDKEFFASKRRYAIVILAMLSAIITPPDAISQVMLLIPMYSLFELGVFMVGVLANKKSEADKAA